MKRCEFGHYYSEHLANCPYCASSSGSVGQEGSTTAGFSENINETTAGFMDDNVDLPTMPVGGSDPTVPLGSGSDININPNLNLGSDLMGGGIDDMEKTVIIDNGGTDIVEGKEKINRPTRKLVGWLVSYTLDEMGLDYRLFEGKNVIGSNVDCEVSVIQDKSVSGRHATILFRNNKFLLRDEFSTNGTFLNDEIVEENTPEVKDGDIIRVGNTIFKFKVAVF